MAHYVLLENITSSLFPNFLPKAIPSFATDSSNVAPSEEKQNPAITAQTSKDCIQTSLKRVASHLHAIALKASNKHNPQTPSISSSCHLGSLH